jgi:hypothetical protein
LILPSSPAADEKKEAGENVVLPDLVILDKDTKLRAYFPKAEKINEEEFLRVSEPILEINSDEDGSAELAPDIYFEDALDHSLKSRFPSIYYYAVRTEDSDREIEGLSKIISISPLSIAGSAVIGESRTSESKLELYISDFSHLYIDSGERYLHSLKLYRKECNKGKSKELGEIELIPEDWRLEESLSVITRFKKYDAVKPEIDYIKVVFAGRDGQGLKQELVTDKDEITKLKGATFRIQVEASSSEKTDSSLIHILVNNGGAGKPEPIKAELTGDWKTYEYDYTLSESATKLELVITPETEEYIASFRIKSVSFKLLKNAEKEKSETENDDEKGEIKSDQKLEPKIESKKDDTKDVTLVEPGHEFVKNGRFSEYPKFIFEDKTFKFGIKYCYSLVSSVNIEGMTYLGDEGETFEIMPRDTFPPAAPKGLYHLARLDSVTLIWQPNKEKDLAGYYIYRKRGEQGKFAKINSKPVHGTEHIDKPPPSELKYFYYLTAVDSSPQNNESPGSEIVEFFSRKDIAVD